MENEKIKPLFECVKIPDHTNNSEYTTLRCLGKYIVRSFNYSYVPYNNRRRDINRAREPIIQRGIIYEYIYRLRK